MKKILFVMTNLENGGIATSLRSLLDIISQDKNLDIDVLLFDAALSEKLPQNVNLLNESKILSLFAVSQRKAMRKSIILGVLRMFFVFVTRLVGNYAAYKIAMLTYPRIGNYDYAVSCTQSAPVHEIYGGCNEFVLHKVNAENKITFLHCDYAEYGINTQYSSQIYFQFDKIAAVSCGVRNAFLESEKNLIDKAVVVHNCHNFESIRALSETDTVRYSESCLNILTAARVAKEKGHMRFLDALGRLKKEGYDFCWHVVGSINEKTEKLFAQKIKETDLSDRVKVYHDTDNPYKYFTNADVFVLPSFHEAAPMVFSEAECLNLPIISTNTLSAKELVSEKNIGIVCQNSTQGLYEAVKYVLDYPQKLLEFKRNMHTGKKPTNDISISEFYKLIGQ